MTATHVVLRSSVLMTAVYVSYLRLNEIIS